MLDYVIDANILIGMLISGKARYKQLVDIFRFVTPVFALKEIDKYKPEILEKTKMSEEQLLEYAFSIFSKTTVLPRIFLTATAKRQASTLTAGIDSKDKFYVAFSIQLDMTLLTNDKRLEKGLRMKGYRKVMLWEEFLKRNASTI